MNMFNFHSHFWLNLHHHLYCRAWERKSCLQPNTVDPLDMRDDPDSLATIALYENNIVSSDLLSCGRFIKISNILEGCDPGCTLNPSCGLPGVLIARLNAARSVYCEKYWELQHARNLEWIAEVSAHVNSSNGLAVRQVLSNVLKTPWPEEPIRVNVSGYATRTGAYMTKSPPRLTIASTEPINRGHHGMEVLYHEASHLLTQYLEDALAREGKTLGASSRDASLWHAVLFYSTGEIMRQHYAGYTPYAETCRLWSHVWPHYVRPLEAAWLPYLLGNATFEEAAYDLVKKVARANV